MLTWKLPTIKEKKKKNIEINAILPDESGPNA